MVVRRGGDGPARPQPGLSPGFTAGVDPVAGRIPVDHLPPDFPVGAHSVVTAGL